MSKKPTVKLELTRHEQEVVDDYARSLIRWDEFFEGDAREKIYEAMVKHKFGVYDISGERMVRRPPWNLVFAGNLCPSCNREQDVLDGNAANKLKEIEGGKLLCKNCGFTIEKSLWEEGAKSNEAEKNLKAEDDKLNEKIAKYNINKQRLDELLGMGADKAERAIKVTSKKE